MRKIKEGDGVSLHELQVDHVLKPLQIHTENLHHETDLVLGVLLLLAEFLLLISHGLCSLAALDPAGARVGALDAVVAIYLVLWYF